MASISKARAAHATLSGTTVDTVTLTNEGIVYVEVANRSGSTTIFFTTDGTAPTASGDNTEYVAPGEALVVPLRTTNASGQAVVQVIGNGNDYSVTAVD